MDPQTLKQLRDSSYVHPELAKILEQGAPTSSLDASTDIPALRAQLAQLKREAAKNMPAADNVRETDVTVPMRDGGEITIRTYQPTETKSAAPVLVMLHGGGFILGGLENEAPLCRKWVEEFGGVSFNVDYRLAPEHKFPTAVHDAYDALVWVQEHAKSYNGDLSAGFIIAGISAGANLAASASHSYRDDNKQPPLTGVYLSIPALLAPEVVPERYKSEYLSRDENKNALIINSEAMKLFRMHYKDDPSSPLMSPAIWPSGHKNLPRTYFQIAGTDPLRDEALIYERMLREESGVETKVDMYPGLPHGFWSWFSGAQFSKEHARDCLEGMRWLLRR